MGSGQPDAPTRRRLAVTVARHPDVWPEAVRLAFATAPRGWWRRPPFLPLPDPAYVRWRAVTAYGGAGESQTIEEDLVAYLRWRRGQ